MQTRDFMLPMPNRGRDGFARKMANYSGAPAMTQALLCDLWFMDGEVKSPLLRQGIGTVWTEHSERVTMRTWAQAARVPEDIRRQMGRWRPTADEGYERATRLNILRAQKTIAGFIRENLGRSDPVDESLVLSCVELKMGGEPQERVEEQIRALSCFLTPHMVGEIEYHEPLEFQPAPAADTSDDDGEGSEEELAFKQEEEKTGQNVRGQYVVSIVGRSGTRTLHKAGECYREPGVHYSHYELLGDEAPATSKYHKACKVCFPKGAREFAGDPEAESSGDVSSSDSQDTSEEDA